MGVFISVHATPSLTPLLHHSSSHQGQYLVAIHKIIFKVKFHKTFLLQVYIIFVTLRFFTKQLLIETKQL